MTLYERFEQAAILVLTSIILIALLVIVRKFIILDLSETEASKIGALAAAALALGVVYWPVRDQDLRERTEIRDA